MMDPTYAGTTRTSIFTLTSSLLIAALTFVASLSGLLAPAVFYPSESLREFALANDVTNLAIGLPILLGSIWLERRGKYLGRLLWPGALMYALYNYLAYVIALPISWLYIVYLLIVSLCLYSLVSAIANIDRQATQQMLEGRVPNRFAGAVLILLGGFVLIRVFAVVASAQLNSTSVEITERSLLLADALLAPAWIIGGVLLWKKVPFGFAVGLPLLFQGSMLFLGLIVVLALQPFLTGIRLPLVDILVVALMGSVCFIPLSRFIRAAA